MQTETSLDDLNEFLTHAGDKGLMPAATAQSLAVAVRNVFSVLDDAERAYLPIDDLDAVVRRFNNKRARDFNPTSLKEYGRRVKRAVEMYLRWKADPANFTVKTRATSGGRKSANVDAAMRQAGRSPDDDFDSPPTSGGSGSMTSTGGGYQTAFPVRPGQVVTVTNVPHDLSPAEAERLAQFIRLLAPV